MVVLVVVEVMVMVMLIVVEMMVMLMVVMVMVMVMMVVVVEAARCDRTARLPLPTASAPAADHATAALVTRRPSPAGGLAHTPAAARYDLIWRW
jgi:hypothetical protein|tara:strand:- start:36 stop:317 length:282 start_codon:yes stop_codon:yes gene_type:complete